MISYSNNCILRISDFDCYDRLSPAGILGLFQDISGEHAERLGIGYEDMLKKDLLWVILKTGYTVERPAVIFDRVKSETVLHRPKRASSVRDYRIYSSSGDLLVRGTTQWAVINAKTRRLSPLSGIMTQDLGEEAPPEFPEGISKLHDFEAAGSPLKVCPGFSFKDRNGHINNARCAELASDALNPAPDEVIKRFQIDFIHETTADEQLCLYTLRQENTARVKAVGADGNIRFICEFGF